MSNNDVEADIVPKGKDWEVVALTESMYAAAPSPLEQENLQKSPANLIGALNPETDRAMLMSAHFGFSPSMLENQPAEPKIEEVEENLNLEGPLSDGVKTYDVEKDEDNEHFESSDPTVDDPFLSNVDEDEFSKLPNATCEAWWRKYTSFLCGQSNSKSVNPYWSVAITAAVVGLVIVGHRWQRENRPQVFRIK
ncbi:chaperone protein DnaK [Striga asiatica]|uniref:Chaperone protein DnaK n=1 Tax=Striga asiatica TaxID=4170 RepID=A0A5A7RJX9_STRAF|nr:chaperone protein DnaK [Striga asiatica]